MLRQIGTKKYDTEKATVIGSWSNGLPSDDYELEILYRKKTGEYFLYCNGGANTKHRKEVAGVQVSHSYLQPIKFDEAKEWAAEHMEKVAYLVAFGKRDDAKKMVSYMLPANIAEKIKRMAAEKSVSAGEIITELVNNAK